METSTSTRLDSVSVAQVLLFVGLALSVLLGGTIALDTIRAMSEGLLPTLFASNELPIWQHALAAVFLCGSLLVTMLTRRVVVLPAGKVSIAGFWFLSVLVLSCLSSRFLSTSIVSVLEWTVYGATFLGAISCLGRTRGPVLCTQVIVGAIAVLALLGIREFGQMKAIDPSWRIMAGWMNPNILGGMFVLGLLPAIGLSATAPKPAQRLSFGLIAVVIGFGLVLTQSRGALLCAMVGVAVFGLAMALRRQGKVLAVAAVIATLIVGMTWLQGRTAAAPGVASAGAASRLGNIAATQNQSMTFRVNLWKTALDLSKWHAMGTGPMTFQHYSGEPGRVTKTTLAHNSFLQLAAESSWLAPILLLGVIGLSLWQVLRNQHAARPEASVLSASIAAALIAGLANNLLDSQFYHFGYGVIFACLVAVATQLSADSSAPEILPKTMRYSAVLIAATFPMLGLLYFGWSEHARASANASALASAPIPEGANFAAQALLASSATDRRAMLKAAADAAPSAKNLRRLAAFDLAAGELDLALPSLLAARRLEPGDPQVLALLYEIYRAEDKEPARRAILQEALAAYDSPYGQVRSLPDLIVTDLAGMLLRENEIAPNEEYKRKAAAIYFQYWQTTWPQIIAMPAEFAAQTGYAGETLPEAVKKLRELQPLLPLISGVDPTEAATKLTADIEKGESILSKLNLR
ncbi:MAG: O-antigen ligase family protein [Chthonomonas sp.]|nr:O-antigen ligase family protein [Chthonomonas sp.]